MNTITVKNLSTFYDCAAVARVARFMAGDIYDATHNKDGEEVVKIVRRGNTYTVTDYERPHQN